jgi:hypothetical protein
LFSKLKLLLGLEKRTVSCKGRERRGARERVEKRERTNRKTWGAAWNRRETVRERNGSDRVEA